MTVALADVCTITMGQAPPGSSYNEAGDGIPLIAGAGDFAGESIAATKFTTKPGKLARRDDVVVSIRASIGAKVWSDGDYCLGRGVAGLRPGPHLEGRFLWHWLTRHERDLAAKGRGATFLQVNRSDIGEMPMELPSLPEQRRIAAILDHADALRAKRRQAITHLDALTQSIFVELFGPPETWHLRWPMTTIGDLAMSVDYGTSSKSGAVGAWPVLRMGNITDDGRIDLGDLKYTDLAPDDIPKYTVRPGDMLFNRTNSREKVGKSAVVRSDRKLAIAGYLIRVRFSAAAEAEFVSAYLGSPHGRAVRRKLAKAAVNQANINATEMRSISVANPPTRLRERFHAALLAIDAQRQSMLTCCRRDDALFASLQSRAFQGEL